MKNIELKNCPNCHERIGIHDIECPYCKYIDDSKYKKYNQKLLKNNNKSKKNNINKLILFIPVITYIIYLLIKFNLSMIIIPLILLNIMCFFTKKSSVFWVIIVEIITLLFNFVYNILKISLTDSFNEIIIFILGIGLIIIPKFIYIFKTKKNKQKTRKK